ncbi:MAG: hypothetical protein VB862_01680, partial [Pirellulaceae bacterium]
MHRRTLLQAAVAIPLAGLSRPAWSRKPGEDLAIMPFGFDGAKNMLYDCRQRPQAVYLDDKVYIGFKGEGVVSDSGRSKTRAMLIRYD